MINYGKYLERFKKLNWVDDETLLNAENLNRLEEFIDILDLRTRSEVGDVIESAIYNDMNQVIDRYGGKYWILIDKPNGVYNRWLRSDIDPTSVKQVSYEGMVFITVKGVFSDAEAVKEEYGGEEWSLVSSEGSEFDIWMCTKNTTTSKKAPAFEGMITFSTLDKYALEKHVEGEWSKVPGFIMEAGGKQVYQYVCTYNDVSSLTGIGSYIGIMSLSTNLDTEAKVKSKYDGTQYAETNWDGYITSAVKQWIRNA